MHDPLSQSSASLQPGPIIHFQPGPTPTPHGATFTNQLKEAAPPLTPTPITLTHDQTISFFHMILSRRELFLIILKGKDDVYGNLIATFKQPPTTYDLLIALM